MVSSNELARHVGVGAKVSWWIKWQSWNDGAAIGITTIRAHSAYGEECPSRRVPRIWYPANIAGLQEVYLILGIALRRARKNYEELKQDATGENDEGHKAENWSSSHCGTVRFLKEG